MKIWFCKLLYNQTEDKDNKKFQFRYIFDSKVITYKLAIRFTNLTKKSNYRQEELMIGLKERDKDSARTNQATLARGDSAQNQRQHQAWLVRLLLTLESNQQAFTYRLYNLQEWVDGRRQVCELNRWLTRNTKFSCLSGSFRTRSCRDIERRFNSNRSVHHYWTESNRTELAIGFHLRPELAKLLVRLKSGKSGSVQVPVGKMGSTK